MWTVIIRLILRNRILILSLLGLFTAFMIYQAKDVGLSYHFAHILPETDSTRIKYDQFRTQFGEDGDVLFLGVDDPDLYKIENFSEWYDLNERLDKIEGVDTVVSLARVYDLEIIEYDTIGYDRRNYCFDDYAFEDSISYIYAFNEKQRDSIGLDHLKDVYQLDKKFITSVALPSDSIDNPEIYNFCIQTINDYLAASNSKLTFINFPETYRKDIANKASFITDDLDCSDYIIALEKSDDLTFEELQLWLDFNNSLWYKDGLNAYNVQYIKDIKARKLKLKPIMKNKPGSQEELDTILQKIRNLPFYQDFLYKEGDDVTLMAITLNKEILNSKGRIAFVNEVQQEAEKFSENTGIDIHYSGLPFIRTKTMEKVKNELLLFIVLAVIVLAIVLYLFFRSFKAVFISLFVVGIAVAWVFGTVSLMGYQITILTGLIPPLIIVIGIPNCIFLLNKYHHEYKKHGNKVKAIATAVRKIGNATFLTNLTTASGFATFIVTQSTILVEFGVVASLNIMGVFIISLLIIPIFSSFLPPPSLRHTKHLDNKWLDVVLNRLEWIVLNRRTMVYLATIALVVVCFIGIYFIKTTGRLVDDIPQDDPLYEDLLFFEDHFSGVMPFEIIINSKEPNGVFKKEKTVTVYKDDGSKETYNSFEVTLDKIKRLEKVFTQDTLEYEGKQIVMSEYFSRPLSIIDAISFVNQAHTHYEKLKEYEKTIKKLEKDKEALNPKIKKRKLALEKLQSKVESFENQLPDLTGKDSIIASHKIDSLSKKIKRTQFTYDSINNQILVFDDEIEKVKLNREARISSHSRMNYKHPSKRNELDDLRKKYVTNENATMNFNTFLNEDRSKTRLSVQMANLGTPEIAMIKNAVIPKLNEIFPEDDFDIELTGMTVVFLKGTNFLINNLFISLSIAILLIAIFIAIMFQSFRMVLITIVPNLIPLIFTAGIMGFAGIPIKPSTILIFSIAFGISVDDSIHYLAKYRQELKIFNWEIRPSVITALRETGHSMIYTSIVLFFGFAIFTASGFGGTQALGILVSITLLVAMLTNLVLLPSLLLTVERKLLVKAYKEPLFQIYDEEEDIELDDLEIDTSTRIEPKKADDHSG
jgi:predicted RND superfamily exporter protein